MDTAKDYLPSASDLDLDHDGKVDKQDIKTYERLSKTALLVKRDQNQVRLAWVAMISIIIITLLTFSPLVADSRVHALSDILQLFYIVQGSIIGFYVGASTYLKGKQVSENNMINEYVPRPSSYSNYSEYNYSEYNNDSHNKSKQKKNNINNIENQQEEIPLSRNDGM